MPIESGTKEQFFAKLDELVAKAVRHRRIGFDDGALEENTKHLLLEPLFEALGYGRRHVVKEYHIEGDGEVDYLLKSDRPLIFVEAKSLLDKADSLFEAHREQVLGYIRTYRFSSDAARTPKPVQWLLLTNFNQFHFLRANENEPTFSFKLEELVAKRDLLWELLALPYLDAGRIDELYDQEHKAGLDARFLTDLKRWRLILANGFALRNQPRSMEEITLASQQLLDRFIFCRMLEAFQLADHDMLAHRFRAYDDAYGGMNTVFGPRHGIYAPEVTFTFAEYLRRFLFLEIKDRFNTELFTQPLLCDLLAVDNLILGTLLGHEPLRPEVADTCGLQSGQGELLSFRHFYSYDFSRMSLDVMGSVYERFLAHKLSQKGGRIVIEDTAELRKKEGIYYTPTYIVDYIVQRTLGEKIKPILAEAKTLLGYKNFKAAHAKIRELSQIKVLDPAMGSGSFLLRAFDTLADAYADFNTECRRCKKETGGGALFDAGSDLAEEVLDARAHVITENIFGVDLDEQAVEVAKLNLWIRYMAMEKDGLQEKLRRRQRDLLPTLANNLKRGNSLIADKAVAGDTAFVWEKEFADANKFDVVIGNPPYERIQVMSQYAPESVEFLKANYRSAASGNFDIYVCFIERGLQLLKADGCFGYICPHKFFQAEYGEPVRKLLSDGKHVRQIVSFGDQQIFPQASTYTCLLFLEKTPQAQSQFIKVDDLDDWRTTGAAASGKIASATFAGGQWNFVLGNGAELFAKLNENPIRLRDVAERIAQGIRTSANPVYVLDVVSMNDSTVTAFSEELQREVKLERKSVAPFLQGQDIRRYGLETCSKVVILPYQIKGGRAVLIAEAQLRKKFPLAYNYLRQNKKVLEEREEGRMRGDEWYAYGRLQNVDLMLLPKILVPDIANFSSFAFDEAGEFAFTSGYGITLKEDAKESPAYLLGLLNSRLLDFYLKQVSTTMRGGYFRYFTQFIEQLPIRRIDPKEKGEVKLEKEIVQRVEAIQAAHRQRVKLPEVLSRLIAHTQNRPPCNLAHYLQKDFTAAVKAEILIDDVQRTGFIHEISVVPDGKELTFTATVSADGQAEPSPLPVLRLTFKDEALQHFIYASWKQFLAANSRQRKWTKGKKPEAIHPLLVNTLESLVYFDAAAGDNLRLIRDLMKSVATEAGSADLAAIAAEIQKLDVEIDERVYELYDLTPDEIKIVEGAATL